MLTSQRNQALTGEPIQAFVHEATKELTRRKILSSMLAFTQFNFLRTNKKKFITSYHHEVICEALDRVLTGRCKRLIINLPPRYGKTELAVKNFIAKGLAHNPSAKFIHLSYSDTLALDNSEEIKDVVIEEWYQDLFPRVQLKKDSKSKKKWYTTADGGVYATSTKGSVTGFGAGEMDEEQEEPEPRSEPVPDREIEELEEFFVEDLSQFAGAIIIDDPIKPEDADSDTVRERVNNRFESTIRNRTNSRNTPIIIIGQRVHPVDLSGHLMEVEPDEWEVISLPAITEKGEALWPHKHTLQELQRLKIIDEVVFERQYMQNPQPKEGLLFPASELNYFDPFDFRPDFKYMAVDPADLGDNTACPHCQLLEDKIFVTDVMYNNYGTDVMIPALVEKIITEKMQHVDIEGQSAWILFAKQVRDKVYDRYEDVEVRIVKTNTNKAVRILAQSAFIKNHFHFLREEHWTPEYRKFMKALTKYMRDGSTKVDDAPDSLTMSAQFFLRNFPELW